MIQIHKKSLTLGVTPPVFCHLRVAFCLTFLILFSVTAHSAQNASQTPARSGFVNDFASSMDDQTKSQLGTLLENVKQKIGIEFAVVTVPTIAGREIFDVSRQFATDWNVGARNTAAKSMLLLLAVDEKDSLTQFSKSVQNDLPEAVLGEMRERIKTHLKTGDVAGGLNAAVRHFVNTMANKMALNAADFYGPGTAVAVSEPTPNETVTVKPTSSPLAVRPRVASAVVKTPPAPSATPKVVEEPPAPSATTKVVEEQPAPAATKPLTASGTTTIKPAPKKSEPANSVTPKKVEPSTDRPKSSSANSSKERTPEQIAEDDADESEEVELTLTLPLEPRIAKLKTFLADFPDSKSKPRAIELLVSAHAGLGDQKLKKGDTADGLAQLNLAIDNAPADMSEKLFSGVIAQIPLNLFLRGERATAAEFAKKIETRFGTDAKRLAALSNYYISTEQAGEAVRIATQAVTIAPDMAEAHQALALAQHISLRLDEALAEYKRALELDQNSKAARRGLADLSRGLGKPEEALALYRQLLANDANDKSARAGAVFALMDLGRTAEAKAEMDAALKADPKSLSLLTGAAYWFAAHNDPVQANDFGRKALDVEPRFTWSHVAMARTFLAQRKPLNAERALRYARQYGKFPTLDYELANALSAAGLFAEAADVLLESFDWKDGQIETRLAGRNLARSNSFLDLLAPERRASIFQFAPADTEANARMLKELLVFTVLMNQDQKGGTLNEPEIVAAGKEFASGNDPALVHRQLYVASRLLRKGIGIGTAHDLAEAARSSADAGLTVPEVTLAVQADEYREIRARAIAAGGTPDVVEAPRNILSNILRGRIEDLSGWALFNQDKNEEAVDHLKRAANILPERTPVWRTAVWHLGAALDRVDRREEALANYIKSYNVGDPDPVRRTTIERLYRKMHGSLAGLDEQIQSMGSAPASDRAASPSGTESTTTPSQSVQPASPETNTVTPPAPVETAPAPARTRNTAPPAANQPSAAESSIIEKMNKPAPSVVTIKGQVTDQSGSPMANVVVVLISPQGTVLASTTDARGNYSFSVAPSSNNYRLVPSKDGFKFEPVDRLLPGVTEDQRDISFVGSQK